MLNDVEPPAREGIGFGCIHCGRRLGLVVSDMMLPARNTVQCPRCKGWTAIEISLETRTCMRIVTKTAE